MEINVLFITNDMMTEYWFDAYVSYIEISVQGEYFDQLGGKHDIHDFLEWSNPENMLESILKENKHSVITLDKKDYDFNNKEEVIDDVIIDMSLLTSFTETLREMELAMLKDQVAYRIEMDMITKQDILKIAVCYPEIKELYHKLEALEIQNYLSNMQEEAIDKEWQHRSKRRL
ncbi:hypothetical protein [Pantoea agglomerans]|uniref:hypothetical protein n=1 Tax=Enterobacter agglomerans TaxID=549 RepID=UPI003C7A8349